MKKSVRMIAKTSYWLVQLTWGSLTTFVGLATLLVLKAAKKKVEKNCFGFVIEVGDCDWGGVSLGPVAITATYSSMNERYMKHIRRHEFGHSVQQLVLGPLFLLLVALPSVIRYWHVRLHPESLPEPYDKPIFEWTASKFGYDWFNAFEDFEKETYARP